MTAEWQALKNVVKFLVETILSLRVEGIQSTFFVKKNRLDIHFG